MGVMSILVDSLWLRAFLPFGAWSDADISAIFSLFSSGGVPLRCSIFGKIEKSCSI
jgi:hypothetical protein